MTSPVEEIIVRCPECGVDYPDWWRPSINLDLDDFDDEYLREASSSTCPHCKTTVEHHVLTVRSDGVWEFAGDDEEEP